MAREKSSPKKPNFTQRITHKLATGIGITRAARRNSDGNTSLCSSPQSISSLLSYQLVESETSNDNPAKPMGLFGLFDNSMASDDLNLICTNQKFFNQLETFREIFPQFPLNMLKALILRFTGNFKEIANHLIDRGWEPENFELISELIDKTDVHFNVPYFYGNNSNIKLLQNAQINTYFTYYQYQQKTTQYYVKYKNQYGRIEDSLIYGPKIDPAEFPFLIHPLISSERDMSSLSFLPLLKYIN